MGLTEKGKSVAEAVASRANKSAVQSTTMSYAMSRAAGIAGGTGAIAATEVAIQAAGKSKQPVPASRTMQEAFMGYSMSRAAGIAGGTGAVEASQAAIVHSAAKAEGILGRPVGYTWLSPPPTVAQRTGAVAQTAPQQTIVEKIVHVVQEGTTTVQEGGTPVANGNGGGDAWEDEEGLFTQKNMLIGGAAIVAILGIGALSRGKK